MQASGKFGSVDVPPQFINAVNNTVKNSSNNSNRSTSTIGSNPASRGHMLFTLSNHDQQKHVSKSASPAAYTATNPHSARAQPNNTVSPVLLSQAALRDAADHAELEPESGSHDHHANPHFSHFLPASAGPSMEHMQQPDGASTEPFAKDAENTSAQQQILHQKQGNLAHGQGGPGPTRHPTAAQTQTVTAGHACATPALMAHHTPVQANSENGELKTQKQAQDMGAQQLTSRSGLDPSMTCANGEVNYSILKARDSQLMQMNADPMSIGDMDQAEEGSAGAGNRWPRQETVALLKIRADMDAAFRDTSVKRPLWDEVSRKLGEMGYERSAKKCKEKFENVNKYYKRTKEGKAGRQDGKSYRFFTQLEALSSAATTTTTNTCAPGNLCTAPNYTTATCSTLTPAAPTTNIIMPITSNNPGNPPHTTSDHLNKPQLTTAPSADALHANATAGTEDHPHGLATSSAVTPVPTNSPLLRTVDLMYHTSPLDRSRMDIAPLCSSSPSSSSDNHDEDDADGEEMDTDGDDVLDEDDTIKQYGNLKPPVSVAALLDPLHALPSTEISKKRKRKSSISMISFFEGLLKKVIDKQEQMQQNFLQAMEKRESDRMIREEAWRRQERARLNKEDELRDQERSSAAAREAALVSFLEKVTGQTIDLPSMGTSTSVPIPTYEPMPSSIPIAAQPVQSAPPLHQDNMSHQYEDHDGLDPSSKRWLKHEVLHLIELHSSLQAKFSETGPKGPLWEEIANGMAKRGYANRTAKRCKEKWENINKYFKRAKESNKKRPENAKTCPYFHELDALYRKGLGSSSHPNQLPYKPSIECAPQDENIDVLQSSISNTEGNFDYASSLPVQRAAMPSESAVVPADANDARATDANTNRVNAGDHVMKSVMTNNGTLQTLGSMQLLMTADKHRGLSAASTSDHSPRSGFSAELGLSIQRQSSSMDIYQQTPVSLIAAEPGKPSNAGGSGHVEGLAMQSQFQQENLKESKPFLAPLPNTSSFMQATMLQKLSSNNTNSNPEDQ